MYSETQNAHANGIIAEHRIATCYMHLPREAICLLSKRRPFNSLLPKAIQTLSVSCHMEANQSIPDPASKLVVKCAAQDVWTGAIAASDRWTQTRLSHPRIKHTKPYELRGPQFPQTKSWDRYCERRPCRRMLKPKRRANKCPSTEGGKASRTHKD